MYQATALSVTIMITINILRIIFFAYPKQNHNSIRIVLRIYKKHKNDLLESN